MANKYIYNRHIAPVTVNARDRKGAVIFTKTFQPERTDTTTGRVVSTGYTALTDEEYGQLCESSRTFTHYKDKLKLLVLHDDVPPEAKTPQEALVDARRKEREAREKVSAIEAENQKLKAALLDSQEEAKRLVSASTPAEVLKSLEDKVAALEAELETARAESAERRAFLEKDIERLTAERDALQLALKNTGKTPAKRAGA